MNGKKCGVCAKVCPVKAIDFEMKDTIVEEKVGAIIAATGYDLFDHSVYGEYGAGRYPDVISGMQYERILSASGPFGGHIRRPSDGREPKDIVFHSLRGLARRFGRPSLLFGRMLHVYRKAGNPYARPPARIQFLRFLHGYTRPGKNYDEFVRRAQEEYGVQYIRGRVGKIYPRGDRMVVQGADTLLGVQVEVEADLVVLATGIESSLGAGELAEKLRISYDQYGFYMESHPKLRPVETNTAGVYLAGACQGPKDIPSSVAQGSAAASKVQSLFAHDTIETNPQVALVNERTCIACGKCIQVCPFGAIQWKELRGGIKKAEVLPYCVPGLRRVQRHLSAQGGPVAARDRQPDTCRS